MRLERLGLVAVFGCIVSCWVDPGPPTLTSGERRSAASGEFGVGIGGAHGGLYSTASGSISALSSSRSSTAQTSASALMSGFATTTGSLSTTTASGFGTTTGGLTSSAGAGGLTSSTGAGGVLSTSNGG